MKMGICIFAVVAFFHFCCAEKFALINKCRHSNVDGKRIKENYLIQPEHFCVYAKFLNGTEMWSCEAADWLHDPNVILPEYRMNECVSGPGFEAFLKCDCPWCNSYPCTVGETRCGKPTRTPNTTTLTPTITSEIPSTTSTPTTALNTTQNEKKTGLLIIIAYLKP